MDRDDKFAKKIKTAHDTFKIINAIYSIENLAQDWKNLKENAWEYFLMSCTIAAVLAVFGIGISALG